MSGVLFFLCFEIWENLITLIVGKKDPGKEFEYAGEKEREKQIHQVPRGEGEEWGWPRGRGVTDRRMATYFYCGIMNASFFFRLRGTHESSKGYCAWSSLGKIIFPAG